MNKYLYRVIFNKKRGIQMVVADIAKTPNGNEKKSKGMQNSSQRSFFVNLKPITLFISISLSFVSIITPTYASDIVADQQANKHQQPQVISTANGITQVNIQTPNQKGLSHNKYTRFDVSQRGAILNNSSKNSKTQIAGYVQGNELLRATGPAKIILNEVNSRNPSQLNGVVEVAGQKAQVIIANPSGITCNGCGFINASRSTLTTGKPIIDNGDLHGYQVTEGKITVTGKGLDSSEQDYTDLIARTVSLNSAVWANEANVITGRNQVSQDTQNITALDDNATAKPEVSIDVSALGGMYAGKIRMVGTEKGVGVRNAGELGASAGSIVISADGKITNNGTMQAKQNIDLSSQADFNNNSQLYAKQDVKIATESQLKNTGTIVAQRNTSLTAKTIENTSTGTLAAGIDNNGKLNNSGSLLLKANNVTTHGKSLATDNIDIQSSENVDLNNGQQIANNIIVTAKEINANQSSLKATNDISLTAKQSINNDHSTIVAKGNINVQGQQISWQDVQTLSEKNTTVVATGTINNRNAHINAKQNISFKANEIDNYSTTFISEQNITFDSADKLINQYAHFNANQQISLSSGLINNQYATFKTLGATLLNANQIDNQQSTWRVAQLALKADELFNQHADMLVQQNANFEVANFNNQDAKILSHDLAIKANQLSGDGQLLAENNLSLKLIDSFHNQSDVMANNELLIETEHDLINDKNIISGNKLQLKSEQFINHQQGEINSDMIELKHNQLTNYGLIDGIKTNIIATILNNLGTGRIYSDDLTLKAETLNNKAQTEDAPVIAARNDLNIKVDDLNNYGHGLLLSLGNLSIYADNINNHSSRIEAGKDMQITANQINNINDNLQTIIAEIDKQHKSEFALTGSNRRYSGKNYWVHWGSGKHKYPTLTVYNQDGSSQSSYKYIEYQYNQTHYQTQITENEPAEIISGGNLIINAQHVVNDNSKIIAGNTLSLTAGIVDNIAETGIDRLVDDGGQIRHKRKWRGGTKRKFEAEKSYSPYHNMVETTLDLAIAELVDHKVITNTSLKDHTEKTPGVSLDKTDTNKIQVNTISTIDLNPTLPKNSLYTVNKDPKNNYLIETDRRFTNKTKWLSSDYMTDRIKSDPNVIQKRLGDGYYEQQLIREQIAGLTGQRYLDGYQNDVEQYKALMNAGLVFAERYNLRVGVALTAEQMEQLTNDMVWLVSKTVMVNGKAEQVLVPQVYIVNRPQLTTQGGLLAGRDVLINSDKTIHSNGNILAKQRLNVEGNSIEQEGTWKGGKVRVNAQDSIKSSGAFIGDEQVLLLAQNDIFLNSTTKKTDLIYGNGNRNSNTVIDKVAAVAVDNGDILIHAGHDVNMNGAMVVNGGDKGDTQIIAGNDLTLGKIETSSSSHANFDKNDYRDLSETHVIGTQIESNGNILLQAGHDITARSAQVTADKALALSAGNDINVLSSAERTQLTDHQQANYKRVLNNKTVTRHLEIDNTTQKGSELSGDTVTINAGNDLNVTGSQVVATHDVNLKAGKDININAAEESYYTFEQKIKKESGLMGSGGLGVTVGKMKESLKQTDTEQAYVGSVVGSTDGNVNIDAGKNINVKASDVIAKQNIKMQGENVNIEALDAKTTYKEEYSYEKSGLTVALTGTVADMYEAAKAVERAKEKGNDKILALQSIKSALAAIDALEDTQLKNQQGQSQASIGISAMLGTQRTEREVNEEQHNVISSSISAGQDVTIIATGNEHQQNGDITIKGSEVRAGNDINLAANRDINVIGAVNTQHSDRDEKSYGGGVGIQLQFGGDESGLRFKGNANFSRERENADGSAWTESIVEAKNKLNIKTGNDANIIGGQLKGDTVKMDIGNNLNIQSLQDTDDYDYEKISASVSGTGGFGGFSANGSLSATNIDSKWASVTDQSGIFAGKGGYDITVGNNTDLKGAVIASEAEDISKNKLDTGTISFSDIKNKANFKVSHISVSGGTGGASAPTAYQNSDKTSSTTKSAVEKGQLIVRNQEEQQQDINKLSRDTASANNPLKQIFDKDKELDKIETVELVKDIAQQAKNVVNKYDRIQAQNDVDKNKDKLSKAEAEKAYKALSDEEKAKYKSVDDYYEQNKASCYYAAVDTQLKANQEKNKNLGTMGGNVSKGIDTATSIVMGIINGDITGGLAGASAPWIAGEIKKQAGDNETARLVAHAVLGAVVAELQGNSGLAGGAGAIGGEIAADIIRKAIYAGKDVKDLTEAEKQNISALAQLAAGLAIAAGGGNVSDVGTAISSSKNAVENNSLDHDFYTDYYEFGLKLFGGDKEAAKDYADSFINKQGAITLPLLGVEVGTPIAIEVAGPAMSACAANPILCANEVAIWVIETLGVEGNPAAGLGMSVAGLANSLSKAQLQELSALLSMEKKGLVEITPELTKKVEALVAETSQAKTSYNKVGKGNAVAQADKVAAQAQKDLLDEINSFTSKSQANKNATMVGAYDPVTGKIAIGNSNANITAEALHPETVKYIEQQLGVKIGEFTSFCKNKAGACAEVSAADQLIRQGVAPERIKFTDAVRPRTVYEQGKITQDSIIKPCENCQITWPKDK